MPYEDARMRAARLFREAVTRDPSLYKEFASKFQTKGVDIGMGAPKGWTMPTEANPNAAPDYTTRGTRPGLDVDVPFMANPAMAAGAMQPASSITPWSGQGPETTGSLGPEFSGITRRRMDYGAAGPAVPGGIQGLSDLGRQRAIGPEFSGETGRRLAAANALRSGNVPPPVGGPIPQNMGSFPPRVTPESANMEFGRERERALMRSPFGDQRPLQSILGPPSPLASSATTSSLSAVPPPQSLPPTGPPSPIIGRTPDALQGSDAFGPPSPLASRFGPQATQLASAFASTPFGNRNMPQPRPPGGAPFAGNMPQPRPGLPTDPSLARDTSGLPPQIAALMGGKSPIAPADLYQGPPAGSPINPYTSAARLPQARPQPPEGPGPALADFNQPPPAAPSPPAPQNTDRVTPPDMEAARQAARTSLQLKSDLAGPGNLALGIPKNPLGTTEMDPMTGVARSPGFNLMGMQQYAAKPQAPLISPNVPPAAGTAPVGDVTQGADLPPPGQSSSLTPQQIQRTMGAQALYNQPPPGMTLPPGVTLPDVGRLGFGDLNVDPSKAPVHRYGSNTGKYAGAALGAIKGLAGGPVGAVVGGALGYKGGKRLGGLADRDFGLGARFSNPNYGQGIVANPPSIMGVEPISQPVDVPITSGTGGIFGQGRRMVGGAMQKALAAVTGGKMSPDAAAKAFGVPKDSLHDSLSSFGSGGRGMGGGYSGGGGNSYSGGSYGGYGGSRINEGIGGAYRNR